MKFIIIIYTTNKLTIVEMENIRGARLRKFNLRKIILGVRMHFRHRCRPIRYRYRRCADDFVAFDNKQHETVRTVRHNQTINFFGPPRRGRKKFFSLASLVNTGPPLPFL